MKIRGEWFWVDRWMGSSARGLPLEARGLYREMLSQAWLRGCQLPNDHSILRRFVAATEDEWRRAWPLVEQYWRVEGDVLVNDTQREIYDKSMATVARLTAAGKKASAARWGKR